MKQEKVREKKPRIDIRESKSIPVQPGSKQDQGLDLLGDMTNPFKMASSPVKVPKTKEATQPSYQEPAQQEQHFFEPIPDFGKGGEEEQ